MDTSRIQGLGAGASALSAGGAAPTMGKEDFLKLLVAQLGHQDPLKPMENQEFVAQLAQFSSLEQMVNVNSNLQLLQVAQASMTNGQVASLLGKQVEARGDQLAHLQQGPESVNFELGGAATEVTIKITDKTGKLVRTINAGPRSAGVGTCVWDGKDEAGNLVGPGTYGVAVSAKDGSGTPVTASTRFKGMVTGVSYKDGVPVLEIGSTTVQVGDVVAVREAPAKIEKDTKTAP